MNKCKNCGFWDKDGATMSILLEINMGLCLLISTSEYGLNNIHTTRKAESICSSKNAGGELICSADFGCNEWVSR